MTPRAGIATYYCDVKPPLRLEYGFYRSAGFSIAASLLYASLRLYRCWRVRRIKL